MTSRHEWTFRRALLEADALADDGRYTEAAERYEALAWDARLESDLRYLEFRIAYMHERLGDVEEALDRYAQMYQRPGGAYGEYAPRAMFRTARILERQLGDVEEAQRVRLGAMRAFPQTTFARDAYFDLKRVYLQRDAHEELLDLLVDLHEELRDTELADRFVFDAGKLLQEELDRPRDAYEMFELLTVRFQSSSLIPEAIWRMGECLKTLGETDAEYDLLLAFIDGRELSIIMGDYNYAQYNPAYKRLAEIHEERGELREAIAIYRRFQQTFPFGLDSDDMQYRIIEHQLALGELREAEASYRLLVREWPESRWVSRAERLIGAAGGQL